MGANLVATATEHLAPAIRRSFPPRRTQPLGTQGRARRSVRGSVAVSDSRQHRVLLRSSATPGGKGSRPCHLARSLRLPLAACWGPDAADAAGQTARCGEPRTCLCGRRTRASAGNSAAGHAAVRGVGKTAIHTQFGGLGVLPTHSDSATAEE